ncbi:hypothetical protein SADUNF_Sadunf15G0067100 [Salix dunnii]|uniref:Uncharacterized protein n=1 Tax=Salix dunnii TaxID=1413687 RepID=A0A835JGD0_9ROSI|nr:hypothetical protein SADUNF_Sadunf15G0067100 [Salix dunnii]
MEGAGSSDYRKALMDNVKVHGKGKWNRAANVPETWLNGGTRLAMLRKMKASPGWKSRIIEGLTRESQHAKTINCIMGLSIIHQAIKHYLGGLAFCKFTEQLRIHSARNITGELEASSILQ